jgi:hypothetical protein
MPAIAAMPEMLVRPISRDCNFEFGSGVFPDESDVSGSGLNGESSGSALQGEPCRSYPLSRQPGKIRMTVKVHHARNPHPGLFRNRRKSFDIQRIMSFCETEFERFESSNVNRASELSPIPSGAMNAPGSDRHKSLCCNGEEPDCETEFDRVIRRVPCVFESDVAARLVSRQNA